MNSGDDESSPGLNVRLRPRKPPNTAQISQVMLRKPDDQDVMSKRTNYENKDTDLTDKADNFLSPQRLCLYCEKKFASNQTISKHVFRIHSLSNQDSVAKCIFCSHSEANLSEIVQHMLNNHPNDYFVCVICHTRLSSASELKEHKFNLCEKQKNTAHLKTPQKNSTNIKRNKRTTKVDTKGSTVEKDVQDNNDFTGIVISCELKPSQVRDEEDIEDNITTNVILPRTKPLSNSAILERPGVIVLDDLQWRKRISQGLSFHNTDADQILSRLGVVHRSPRAGESIKKEGKTVFDESTQKFEKCFDTNFYSKVASNVQDNLTKYLDGSFNFKPGPGSVVTTRRSKFSVNINTVEGFPILLACEQYSRNVSDGYVPRASEMKHKWKWGNAEFEKTLSPININRDSHTNNCIITLVSSLDIWTQLHMRKKFDEMFNRFAKEKANERQNLLGKELKEILESREISKPEQVVPYQSRQIPKGEKVDFSASLGLMPSAPTYNVEPAVLSGEWVRPRCYVCCACGEQTRDSRTLSTHISTKHPNAQVQHYEIVGDLLLNADILKHLYVPPSPVSNRTRPLRGFKECTKCNKSISLEDLHQHMLDCAGDTPAVRRKQCRYRLFGVRKRRPRLPDNTVRKKIRKDIRNQQKRPKSRLRPRQRRIRSEVGDAETIRKMIADLPPKRQRIMVNPHQVTRPRNHLDRKRNKLAVKRRLSGDSAKDIRKNNEKNSAPPTKAGIKSKIVRVISTRQNSAMLSRKVALSRLKKKSILAKKQNQSEDVENEVLSNNSKLVDDSFSIDGQSQKKSLKGVPFNATEHGNKNGSTNQNQQQSNYEGQQNNPNNAQMPAQNIPLKHSIALLTANSERHDKSVQFHHLFLVQQECNDVNQSIKQFHKRGPPILFENEEAVFKPDKPPINMFHGDSGENRNKFRQNKPRKGLNDCIAMLKNKLTDVTHQVGHVSVKCGSDEPLEPDLKIICDAKQESLKSNVSSNWMFSENKTNDMVTEKSVSEPGIEERVNSKDSTKNNSVTEHNLPKDLNVRTDNSTKYFDMQVQDLTHSKPQPHDLDSKSNPQSCQDLRRQNTRLAEIVFCDKQEENSPQLIKPTGSTPNEKLIVDSTNEISIDNNEQYEEENIIEIAAENQLRCDFNITKPKELSFVPEKDKVPIDLLPAANLDILATEIPVAHSSTKVESIISAPLDLSFKINTSSEQLYSAGNNDYETLDLSNKSGLSVCQETDVAECVVDLSLKSTYKHDMYEQQNIPTDLSSKAKKDSAREKTETFTKNTTVLNRNVNSHKINVNEIPYMTCGKAQENFGSMCAGRTDILTTELNDTVLPTDYCLSKKSNRDIDNLFSRQNCSQETTDQEFSRYNYKNTAVIGVIPSHVEEPVKIRNNTSKMALGTLDHPQIDNSLQHINFIQQSSAINLADENLAKKTFPPSAQSKISQAIVNKISSNDKSLSPELSYAKSENNSSSNYVTCTSEDFITAPRSYPGTASQLNSLQLLMEEQKKEKAPRKDHVENDSDVANKVAMLPKELVEVLGKMPVDHRNQLMDILKQYVSSPSTTTVSQYEAARTYMSTAGLLADNNMGILHKQQAGDNTVTTSDLHTLNQTVVSPSIKDPKPIEPKISKKLDEPEQQFKSSFMLQHTIPPSINSDRVVNLTEDQNVKVQESYISADYCSSEKTSKQRFYSDQTASLRAVRIKAPSERRKEIKLINEKQNFKGTDSNESENCECVNEFLAIQQAEVSSTQHNVKNMVTDSQLCLPHERESSLEHSNENTSGTSTKNTFDSNKTNLKTAVVTSSIVTNNANVTKLLPELLNPNVQLVPEVKEQNLNKTKLLVNEESLEQVLPIPQCQITCTESVKEIVTTTEKDKKLISNESKSNATEDDSEDDMSLALIVRQKNDNSAETVSECKEYIVSEKKKRKTKKGRKRTQQRKNIKKPLDSHCSLTKERKSEVKVSYIEVKSTENNVTKETENVKNNVTTEKILKSQNSINHKSEIITARQRQIKTPTEKQKEIPSVSEITEISSSSVTCPGETHQSANLKADNDLDSKSFKKTLRSRKTNVITDSTKNQIEESVPLRRSRRGKSLVFEDIDRIRHDISESKPLLTKKQLIFSKLLLDNEVLHQNDLPNDKNDKYSSNPKENVAKNIKLLHVELATDKLFPQKNKTCLETSEHTDDNNIGNAISENVSINDVSENDFENLSIPPLRENVNVVTENNFENSPFLSLIETTATDGSLQPHQTKVVHDQAKISLMVKTASSFEVQSELESSTSVKSPDVFSKRNVDDTLSTDCKSAIVLTSINGDRSKSLTTVDKSKTIVNGRNNDQYFNSSQCTNVFKSTNDQSNDLTNNIVEQSSSSFISTNDAPQHNIKERASISAGLVSTRTFDNLNILKESKYNVTSLHAEKQFNFPLSIADEESDLVSREKSAISLPKSKMLLNPETTKITPVLSQNLLDSFEEQSQLQSDVESISDISKHIDNVQSKHSRNLLSQNNKSNKSACVELIRYSCNKLDCTFEVESAKVAQDNPSETNTKSVVYSQTRHGFSTKKKRLSEKQQKNAENYFEVPIAARRARSKSVAVKTLYDPYDMDNMDEETKPLTSLLKGIRSTSLTQKDSKTDVTGCFSDENVIRNPEGIASKLRIKAGKKDTNHILIKDDKRNYKDNEDNAVYSDDSTKSDVPLQKYVTEKKGTDNRKVHKLGNSKTKSAKTQSNMKSRNKDSENKNSENVLESEEHLRSEQFMESFGFFSQRKPRKSNLLATKKISETFHSIAVESDDTSDVPKSKVTKRNSQLHDESKKNKRGRKKKEPVPVTMTTCYCMICKKEFRRPDNYVRHQMTLLHVSKLCEVELNIKPPLVYEETNYLIAYKNELDKIKKKSEEDKLLNKKVVIPSLEEILMEVHKTIRAQQLSRRGLSRDEALFLDCCELLKKSHKNDSEKDPGSSNSDVDNVALPQCAFANCTQKTINEAKIDSRSDGDVDSITAKNILESEEVRNLEKDLISGLKEAAEMHSRNECVSKQGSHVIDTSPTQNKISSQTSRDQSYNVISISTEIIKTQMNTEMDKLNSGVKSNLEDYSIIDLEAQKLEKSHVEDLIKDETAEDEPVNTITDPCKMKKSLEVKEKMYPDLDNIDIFEDKFDKIKRKCRSQAAAARQVQQTVESTLRNKERKKADKNKLKRAPKKKQHSTILTKGALKGFDNIKESNDKISTDIYENICPKKKKKSNTKKKKDKKVNKHENNGIKLDENSTSQKKIDVYEFMDNEDVELFELRPSTLMERFKNINNKETSNRGLTKPDLDNDDADGFTSESGSDGDDFVYMSDDYVVGSDNETENSVVSCETENGTETKKIQRKRDITEKNAVMGKIFKNNAVRGDKRLTKYKESAKHKANLDKLFDSLLSEEPVSQDDRNSNDNNQISPSSEDCDTTTKLLYDNFAPPKDFSSRKRKRISDHIEKDDDVISSPKKNNVSPQRIFEKDSDDEKLKLCVDITMTPVEINKDCADGNINYNSLDEHGIAPQRARRKCTVGKQNVLAETWSSESEPDLLPSRPNSVESDATVVGRKKKFKRKDTHTSVNRRNKQKANIKKQDSESNVHKSSRVRPISGAKTLEKVLTEPDEGDIDTKIEICSDDPYHMPTPSTSGYDGSAQRRSRTSSYYWSGDGEEEPEHPQQHGWIVGDSHKKLVTMLAHAKGRKRNNDNSLVD